ncbi:HAD family hydrolase [Halosimplex litoreum]|uniref:HAD family hydrolase n=1 Tax=Halosimplex litoreum TaxID=1198301 RepID=A0A7T3FVQ9_9EURY|nr:HAD family hydrolase [Halosimplex litoreum]QPV61536.1 HAD family hydrolase [Halosimplex litoreum]
MVEAVIFDFGGTLFHGDDAVGRAVDARYREMCDRGYEIDRETFDDLTARTGERFADRYHGDYRRFELGRYTELFFEVWDRDAPQEDIEALDRVFWETRLDAESPDEDAESVLGHCCDRDLFVGAITNGNELMTDRRLESLDVDDAFDLVLTSAAVEAEKSTVEPFEAFLDRTGLDGEDCLMVGDRVDEDTWASEVGMTTVQVTAHATPPVGEVCEPDYVVETLGEVEAVIDDLG